MPLAVAMDTKRRPAVVAAVDLRQDEISGAPKGNHGVPDGHHVATVAGGCPRANEAFGEVGENGGRDDHLRQRSAVSGENQPSASNERTRSRLIEARAGAIAE